MAAKPRGTFVPRSPGDCYFIPGSGGGNGALGVATAGDPLEAEGTKDGIGGADGNEVVGRAGAGSGDGELEDDEPPLIGGNGTIFDEGVKAEGTVLGGAAGAAAGAIASSICAGIPLGTS